MESLCFAKSLFQYISSCAVVGACAECEYVGRPLHIKTALYTGKMQYGQSDLIQRLCERKAAVVSLGDIAQCFGDLFVCFSVCICK